MSNTVTMGVFTLHRDWVNLMGNNAVEDEFLECVRDGVLELSSMLRN